MTLKEDAIAIFRQRGQAGTLGEFVDAIAEAVDRRMAAIDEREARQVAAMEARAEREAAQFAELMRQHDEIMRQIRELRASQGG